MEMGMWNKTTVDIVAYCCNNNILVWNRSCWIEVGRAGALKRSNKKAGNQGVQQEYQLLPMQLQSHLTFLSRDFSVLIWLVFHLASVTFPLSLVLTMTPMNWCRRHHQYQLKLHLLYRAQLQTNQLRRDWLPTAWSFWLLMTSFCYKLLSNQIVAYSAKKIKSTQNVIIKRFPTAK